MRHELKQRARSILLLGLCLLMSSCDNVSKARANALPLEKDRAYSGAPPVTSHKVKELGRFDCLACHLNGNAKEVGGALPKKTPHPEFVRCRNCHLEKTTDNLFRKNNFVGSTYKTGIRSQQNGPWLIPHPLTMRENCLGCHGDRADPEQLKTTHPERVRCMQCHIPAHQGFPRSRSDLTPPSALGGELPLWSL